MKTGRGPGDYQGKIRALGVALKLRNRSLTLRPHPLLGTNLRRVSERAAAWTLLMRTRVSGRKGHGRKESIKEK